MSDPAKDDDAELERLLERYAARLPLHANDTPDYAVIIDAKGENPALTTEPELILAINALPRLLAERRALREENERLRAVALDLRSPDEFPPTPAGADKYYVVVVKRAHNGQSYTFAACHLYNYPLYHRDDEGRDGTPTTGWFTAESSGEDVVNYNPLLSSEQDVLLGWAAIPDLSRETCTAPRKKITSRGFDRTRRKKMTDDGGHTA